MNYIVAILKFLAIVLAGYLVNFLLVLLWILAPHRRRRRDESGGAGNDRFRSDHRVARTARAIFSLFVCSSSLRCGVHREHDARIVPVDENVATPGISAGLMRAETRMGILF
jgi:hypothetical protein